MNFCNVLIFILFIPTQNEFFNRKDNSSILSNRNNLASYYL